MLIRHAFSEVLFFRYLLDAGHLEMAESPISKGLLEVISNRAAGNGGSPGQPPLPDLQGYSTDMKAGTSVGHHERLAGVLSRVHMRRLP
jgi:hypothetical protein